MTSKSAITGFTEKPVILSDGAADAAPSFGAGRHGYRFELWINQNVQAATEPLSNLRHGSRGGLRKRDEGGAVRAFF